MEVYFALNRANGKAYEDTAPVRFKRHCSNAAAGSPYYFHRAIRKYGADAFDVLTVWKGTDAANLGKEHSADTKRKIGSAVSAYKKEHPQSYAMLDAAKGGRAGGHVLWHVKRGITNPDCVLCMKGGY